MTKQSPEKRPWDAGTWILVTVMAFCISIEVVLSGADWNLVAAPTLRLDFYEYAGFWPGLLRGWEPNYTAQQISMFFSYAFLHGGLVHLGVNMMTLWSLGQAVIDRVGSWGFIAVYVASMFGGAGFFGLLSPSLQPMVGASGALFGLAGAMLSWAYVDRFSQRVGLWPVVRMVLILFGLNVVMWWALNGQLAWETHLGGFVMGWIVAMLIDPRPMPMDADSNDDVV